MIINAAPGSGKSEFVGRFITFEISFKWNSKEKAFFPCRNSDADKTVITFPVSRLPLGDFVDFDFGIFEKHVVKTVSNKMTRDEIVDHYCALIDGLHEVESGFSFLTNILHPKIAHLITEHGGFILLTATCESKSAEKKFIYHVFDWVTFAKRWDIKYLVLPTYISHPESMSQFWNSVIAEGLEGPGDEECDESRENEDDDSDGGRILLHVDRMEVYSSTRLPETLYMIPEFETDEYHCFVKTKESFVERSIPLEEVVNKDEFIRDLPDGKNSDAREVVGLIRKTFVNAYDFLTRSCSRCKS